MATTTSLSGVLQLLTKWSHSKTVTGQTPTVNVKQWTNKIDYANGAGADQCEEMYHTVRTLAAGDNETLDLSGTGIQNLVGDNIAFTKIKGMAVWLLAADDTGPDGTVGNACSGITIGAASSNSFAGNLSVTPVDVSGTPTYGDTKFTVKNGGWHGWGVRSAAGYAVTNASNDKLKINNDDGAVAAKYVLTIWGAKT